MTLASPFPMTIEPGRHGLALSGPHGQRWASRSSFRQSRGHRAGGWAVLLKYTAIRIILIGEHLYSTRI